MAEEKDPLERPSLAGELKAAFWWPLTVIVGFVWSILEWRSRLLPVATQPPSSNAAPDLNVVPPTLLERIFALAPTGTTIILIALAAWLIQGSFSFYQIRRIRTAFASRLKQAEVNDIDLAVALTLKRRRFRRLDGLGEFTGANFLRKHYADFDANIWLLDLSNMYRGWVPGMLPTSTPVPVVDIHEVVNWFANLGIVKVRKVNDDRTKCLEDMAFIEPTGTRIWTRLETLEEHG